MRQEAFTLKKKIRVCPSYLDSNRIGIRFIRLMHDVHLIFQNWASALSPNLFHLLPSLARFMASPSFLLLGSKFWRYFFILLFLSHMTSNQSGNLIGAIFKINPESDHWPVTTLLFSIWVTGISSSFQHFIIRILKYTTTLKELYTDTHILNS